MHRIRQIALLVVALFALGAPGAAHASYEDAIDDCYEDGKLDGSYSNEELKDAEQNLPTDIRQYSDCEEVLRAARAGGPGKRGRKGSGAAGIGGGPGAPNDPALITESGAVGSSKEDIDALARETANADRGDRKPVDVAGRAVVPGDGGLFDVASSAAGGGAVPLPLLLALSGLAGLAALGSGLVLRRRWPETRSAALRLLRR